MYTSLREQGSRLPCYDGACCAFAGLPSPPPLAVIFSSSLRVFAPTAALTAVTSRGDEQNRLLLGRPLLPALHYRLTVRTQRWSAAGGGRRNMNRSELLESHSGSLPPGLSEPALPQHLGPASLTVVGDKRFRHVGYTLSGSLLAARINSKTRLDSVFSS
ncbi:hypothetical protein E2C01_047304 [Portunus trituberculatus]|uniref:Uncharacterized protein n=1 Tax=Portunus trituberculatus TaxID=210409 RepID=A0A5B7G7L7_PORTR|nr:hypothetical protein [Portunus trituberculatus]